MVRASRRKVGTATEGALTQRLEALARNLWWTWNADARRLFEGLEPSLWEATGRTPIAMIRRLTPERLATLAGDEAFLANLAASERALHEYLSAPTWFSRSAKGG